MKRKVVETALILLRDQSLSCKEITYVRDRLVDLYEPEGRIERGLPESDPMKLFFSATRQRSTFEEKVRRRILSFYIFCNENNLPAHNMVAFYTSVIDRADELCATEMKKQELEDALICAIAGNGFVFGTTFDTEYSRCTRPSDFLPDNERYAKEYLRSLDSHSMLTNAQYFLDNLDWYESQVRDPIRKGKKAFKEWNKEKAEKTEPSQTSLAFTKEEIDVFVTIFELYALLQDQNDQGQYLNEKSIRATAELNRTLMGALQTIANHCEGIKRAKTIEERRQQITLFSQYLNDIEHKKSLELLKKMDPETIITDSAYFSAIRSYPKNSKAQKKEYPSLSDESSSLSFTDEEKRALEAYKKHRWIKWLLKLEKSLLNPKIQVIAPYFITIKCLSKNNPFAVFKRKSFSLKKGDTAFHADMTRGESSQKKYQRAHRFLYNTLEQWWNCIISVRADISAPDKILCDYLYDRKMSVVSDYDYRITESGKYKRFSTMDPIAQIVQRLEECFLVDVSIFPQYAKCRITNYLLLNLTVVLKKTRIRDWTIENTVANVIKPADIEAYKKLAFLDPNGIGNGRPEARWHLDMAKWFDDILFRDSQKNKMIRDYCSGDDPDPIYPGTNFPISVINDAVSWNDSLGQLYPEDYSTNLARVELAMQIHCCKRIYSEYMQKVTLLYKRIFWGDDPF